MSASELTKEEVEVLRDRTQRTLARCLEYPYKDWDGGRVKELVEEQLSLLTTLDAVQRERDDTVKEGLRLTVELEQRTAQVQALEGSLHSVLSDLSVVEKERDIAESAITSMLFTIINFLQRLRELLGAYRERDAPRMKLNAELDQPYCENCKR